MTTQPPSPSPLMGEESKSLSQCLTRDQRVTQPLILGSDGEQYNTNHQHQSHGQPTTAAHVTDCTRNNHPYPNQSPLHMPIHVKSPMKRGDAAPYLSMPVPPTLWIPAYAGNDGVGNVLLCISCVIVRFQPC